MPAAEELRQAQMELPHANRVTIMGQMAASIVHEVNQPITAGSRTPTPLYGGLGANPLI
jgi:C4-dicarboxylate-specific signal transduction histidine kinase